MKIKILGTKGEIEASKPNHSKQSGVLFNNSLLIDLGEREYLDLQPEYILITHLHPDHAYYVRHGEDPPRKVYTPENFHKERKFGKFRVKPFPTHHSIKVESQAYLVRKGKKRVLYTGDMIWINKEYHSELENLDLVITEASFIRKGGMIRRDKETGQIYGHNGVPDLINLFSKFTDRIVFMHFGSWLYKDVPRQRRTLEGLSDEVELIAAYDGMELEV